MPSDTIPIELMDARELQDALAEAIGYVKNDERVPEARRPAGEYWHWSKGDGVHFELWAFCPVPDFLSASALGFVARHTPPMWNITVSSVPRRDNTVEWFCSATKRPALPPGAPVTQRDSAVARGATEILARARLVLKIAREDLDAAAWLAGVRMPQALHQ